MSDDLVARLQSHARAFEGLMSLIPAKYYYGEDNDDQWKRKKQTKEEKVAAKRAKLDPSSYKSALDVHKEMELKRKRELEVDDESSLNEIVEQPRQGLKDPKPAAKKQKTAPESVTLQSKPKPSSADVDAQSTKSKAEKRKEKRKRKKAQKAHKKEKKEAKKARQLKENNPSNPPHSKSGESSRSLPEDQDEVDEENDDNGESDNEELGNLELDGLVDHNQDDSSDISHPKDHTASSNSDSSRSPSPQQETSSFDDSAAPSSGSSTSSINPPSEPEPIKPADSSPQNSVSGKTPTAGAQPDSQRTGSERTPKLPIGDQEVLKERLAARIAALRAARKADGLDGKPARNRAELIEARRRREETRRAAKKEQRNKAKENDAEAEARRLRGESDSPLWSSPGVFGPPISPQQDNNFSFGKLKFDDGTQMDSSSSTILDPKKAKGPQDPKTALEAAQNKAERLNGLDAEKRAEIEEKDRWLKARKRVEGEKLKDDVSLLKKTLKKKAKTKEKSEKEWRERNEGVQKSIEARQAKRTENLAKRKQGKGGGGGKKGSAPAAAQKPVKRPGFEGSFKTGKRNFL